MKVTQIKESLRKTCSQRNLPAVEEKNTKSHETGIFLLPQRYHNILDHGLELHVSQAHFQSDLAALSSVGVHD